MVCITDWQASSSDNPGTGDVFPRSEVGPGGSISAIEVDEGNLIVT